MLSNCNLLANSILHRNNQILKKFNQELYLYISTKNISKLKIFFREADIHRQVSLFDCEKIINNKNS